VADTLRDRDHRILVIRRCWTVSVLVLGALVRLAGDTAVGHARCAVARLGGVARGDRMRASTRRPDGHVPQELREMLEALGPTFVKLGQTMAGRTDVLPLRYRTELGLLRDHVHPLPPGVARAVVEGAYGRPIRATFESLSEEPIAAASIGQVHRGVLLDGRRVAVKIRRPDVAALIEADLAVIVVLVRVVDRLVARVRRFELPEVVEQFGQALRGELDYEREATDAASIRAALAPIPWVIVPAPILELCRADVLVMDLVDGVPIHRLDDGDEVGPDRRILAVRLVAANLRLILFHDLFQADPHLGNFLVTADGRLAMVDFGQVGRSTQDTRTGLFRLLGSVVSRNHAGIASAVNDLFRVEISETEKLGRAVAGLADGLLGHPLETVRIGPLLRQLLDVLDTFELAIPVDLTLLLKSVIECEATAEEIDPGLELTEVLGLVLGGTQALAVA
jgi:ubiquinone biosynthesis protein